MTSMPRRAGEILADLHRPDANERRWTSTGLYALDDVTSVIQPGLLTIVAGPMGSGRTAFLLGLAECQPPILGTRVLFYSLEHRADRLLERMLWSKAEVAPAHYGRGNVSESEFQSLVFAAGHFDSLPLYVDDPFRPDPAVLAEKAETLTREGMLGLVLVDGADRIEGGDIGAGLKNLAVTLGVPVVASALIPQTAVPGAGTIAAFADPSLEREADVILVLGAPPADSDSVESKRRLTVARNGSGPRGEIEIAFNRKRLRFENLARPIRA